MSERVTSNMLFSVLDLMDSLCITYWLDGGWGVDVLVGKETRPHRDVDIDFDAAYTEQLITALKAEGYKVTTDQMPVRMELYHPNLGYIDIHPFVLNDDGTSKQADPNGGWYVFEPDYFGTAEFTGRVIPCISPKGQMVFHSGYELRDVDHHDIANIKMVMERND